MRLWHTSAISPCCRRFQMRPRARADCVRVPLVRSRHPSVCSAAAACRSGLQTRPSAGDHRISCGRPVNIPDRLGAVIMVEHEGCEVCGVCEDMVERIGAMGRSGWWIAGWWIAAADRDTLSVVAGIHWHFIDFTTARDRVSGESIMNPKPATGWARDRASGCNWLNNRRKCAGRSWAQHPTAELAVFN